MLNKGEVCVSVTARSASEMFSKAERAARLGDVIEIRFDSLEPHELEKCAATFARTKIGKPLLATFRPRQQGGMRDISLAERVAFWEKFADTFEFVDYEADVFVPTKARVIKSFHDFADIPSNLSEIYRQLSNDASYVKIAVHAADASESLKVWRLLNKQNLHTNHITPIAMGASGQWTRILGLAHGAKMTYAALDETEATAPSQITALKLTKVFRAKNLTRETAVYGLLAADTSYSVSPEMHNEAFRVNTLDAVYVPFAVNNLPDFWRDFVTGGNYRSLNLQGFSVTNPHKCAIINLLDEVDETARKIGAVNTVHIRDGRTYGFNTDAEGFVAPLLNSYGDLRGAKVALIGSGGAARACLFALWQNGAETTIFARDSSKAVTLADEFSACLATIKGDFSDDFNNFDILINATPLGTKNAHEKLTPALAEQLGDVHLVYDLVYNPFETRLLREAAKANVPRIGGLAMLVAQAIAQQKIWTGRDAPLREMSRAALIRLEEMNRE